MGDRIWVVQERSGTWAREVLATWPQVAGQTPAERSSEAGLWGLAVDPTGDWLYAMGIHRWSENPGPEGRPRGWSRVARWPLSTGQEPAWEEVLAELPAGAVHSGGALAFGPQGKLYVSVGDGGAGVDGERGLAGTILRLNPDGTVPQDNPVTGSPIFARGLRNPYGLAFAGDGVLYATENGPDCCDRLLRVSAGDDFGWPDTARLPEQVEESRSDPRLAAPLWDSGLSRIGPTGLAFEGERTLLFATWHTAAIHRVALSADHRIEDHRIVFEAPSARPAKGSAYPFAGGFTALARGPEGRIWFTSVDSLGRFR